MKNIFFTEEHLSIRDMVREFSQTEIAPFASEFDRTQKFPTKIINKMGDLGLMGMIIPNKYGGAGGGHRR